MTIQRKLTVILMAASSIAVLVTSMLFYHMVEKHFQETYHDNLVTLAAIVGDSCHAALLFDVPEDAASILNALGKRQSVIQVILYDRDNNIFASFRKEGGRQAKYEKTTKNNAGVAIQEITMQDGSVIGRIVIHDDMRDITTSKKKILYILLIVATSTLLLALFLSSFLQRIISTPLQSLTTFVQDLSSGNFPDHKPGCMARKDEMGHLCNAFFQMSNSLKESHEKLEEYNRTLAIRVAERTNELKTTMKNLAESQTQLVQSEKMAALGLMVAGVTHEVNNNINFISSATPSLSRKINEIARICHQETLPRTLQNTVTKTISDLHELLANISEGVRRTQKIVHDLATFSQPSHGQSAPANVNNEIEKCITLLRYKSQNRIEFILELTPDIPLVTCIQDQINQVYFNILLNSIQAISNKGQITIKTSCANDMVQISFHDNGPGIPDNALSKVFDPFYTTKAPGKGTGLGLSISYSIIKKHHGTIQISSENGTGTTVVLLLPVMEINQDLLVDSAPDHRGGQ